ncbi:hypothetical protein C7212DRAFT_363341 [Tuber magnatum]|uniref:Extracellular membrane protein CFEM domain-containing protein n=1 Tax=Tuber magnatum TaxID=42249 RepID=A0A317SRF6_9PEZI|nr:hypothetical protein C7212DRAFT_363341 [Tuber magnatum]
MFTRALLPICFLATGLAVAQCPFKAGSEVSDEDLSAIFTENDSRSCKARQEDCTRLIRNCVSGLSDEPLRISLESARQRFCEGRLRAGCEAGGGGGTGSGGGGSGGDGDDGGGSDESDSDDSGNDWRKWKWKKERGRDRKENGRDGAGRDCSRGYCGNGGNDGNNDNDYDKNVSRPTASNPASQIVSISAPPEMPNPSPSPSSRAAIESLAGAPAPTSTNTPTSETAPAITTPTNFPASTQTTTATASQTSNQGEHEETGAEGHINGHSDRNSTNSTIAANGLAAYRVKWTLFCTDRAKDAIVSAGKDPPRKCNTCDPKEVEKKEEEKGNEECGKRVFEKWPKEFWDLLGVLERVSNGTDRGLKFPQGAKVNGALGNGDLNRGFGLLGTVLGVGSVVWWI